MPIVMRKRNHPFVINDPVTGRSVRVRFIAKAQEIDDCLSAWEIIGSPARTDRLQDDSSLAAAA